ncbi:clumping factor b protein [Rutstroemia sp. NJR-2017a BBW]|nr:clumping factor b protein [Rutstroemia sp. NJR-2017a BBW]
MRLRITVRRHDLPDCPIIWDANTETHALTVSELLHDVNEVVPIESAEWGLEDYAVEVKGTGKVNYECLHFQPVSRVMKEDDEVIIRPLLTQDLRIRRISGRHQISSDGKHLVDGVAFGRPMLRRPANRPAIDIPPRKRRKIILDEADNENEEDDTFLAEQYWRSHEFMPGQLTIEAGAYDNEDDEEDDDFDPDAVVGSDESDEVDDDEMTDEEDEATEGEDGVTDEDADEDADEEITRDSNGNRQLVLHADFENEDEEDDEDFEPEGNIDEDEVVIISSGEDDTQDEESHSNTIKNKRKHTPKDEELSTTREASQGGARNESKEDKIHTSVGVIKHIVRRSHGDMSQAYDALAIGYTPAKSKSSLLKASKSPKLQPTSAKDNPQTTKDKTDKKQHLTNSTDTRKSDREDIDSDEASSGEEAEDLLLNHYDHHGLPSGSITSGRALKFMAEVTANSVTAESKSSKDITVKNRKSDKPSSRETYSKGLTSTPIIDLETNDEESSEDSSEEEEDSSSDDSSDESSSEDDSEEPEAADSSSSDSDSESDSDSDSSSEASSDEEAAPEVQSSKSRPEITKAKLSPEPTVVPAPEPRVPPGQGKKQTQSRNQRRRQSIALSKLKEKHILPEDTKPSEFSKLDVNDSTSPEDALAALMALRVNMNSKNIRAGTSKAMTKADEFETRKRELLASLASGGIEVGQPERKQQRGSGSPSNGNAVAGSASDGNTEMNLDPPEHASNGLNNNSIEAITDIQVTTNGVEPDMPLSNTGAADPGKPISEPRRAKLDLGAGRRLLFGALGMKNPKTKQDEDKLRNDLLKDIKVQKPTNSAVESASNAVKPMAEDDSWREKINYRAVECCHEGVVLSEPPFPFIQRWDPQQNGKRKNQAQHQNEDSRKSKKQKRRKGKQNYVEEHEDTEEPSLPSYPPHATETQSTEQSLPARQIEITEFRSDAEPNSQGIDDLMELPEDPSSLSSLDAAAIKPGMVIAFKQFIMDESTRWQPQISEYRTASVLATNEKGEISLVLAKRDREQSVKNYDEDGQRIWGKFEMPNDDEEYMDEDDNGERLLTFKELVEPKLVSSAPVSLSTEPFKTGLTTDESVTLGNDEESEAPFSHVTETQLHSDIDLSASSQIPGETTTPHAQRPELDLPAALLPESITDNDREEISRMIKEAGFRSNVPSSVIRNLGPNGSETPREAAELEKLRKDMAEIDQSSYSPKFNGFGTSSPIRQREISPSPGMQQPSWQNEASQEFAGPFPHENYANAQNEQSRRLGSNDAVDADDQTTSQNSHNDKSAGKVNVNKAHAQSEALQPKEKAAKPVRKNAQGDAASDLLDENTIVVDTGVEYPNLSGSFSSLVTDHGRQPDFNFDDSGPKEINGSKEHAEMNNTTHNAEIHELEPELPSPRQRSRTADEPIDLDKLIEPSSDDFPTVQEILSQASQSHGNFENEGSRDVSKSQAVGEKSKKILAAFDTQSSEIKPGVKSEKILAAFADSESESETEKKSKKVRAAFADDSDSDVPGTTTERKTKTVLAAFADSDPSEGENEVTPKPSKPPKPQTSQADFSIPEGSQFLDLTRSSDAEAGADSDEEPAFEQYKQPKQKPQGSDDDPDLTITSTGWGPKKDSTLKGLKRYDSNSSRSKSAKRKF